ncbi:MAG: transglycosylase SLT domain-containing protein [Bacteroidetes bacterium]|nr:transglycosylase SLT domain-containing protein [Bacteroidota bacterium]
MNKNITYLAALCISSFFIYHFFVFSINKSVEDANYQRDFMSHYKIFSISTPDTIRFAGEVVPVFRTDVKEKLDRELLVNTYWQSSTVLLIKKASRWFPVIEPILARNGIPEDFKYLPMIESGFAHVVSPAKASGFWQIMEKTGTAGGLEINKEVDERYHIEKATQLACDYLNRSYKKYKDWTLAAASYNIGMRNLNSNLNKQQVNSYYDLLLNTETGRYVYRLVAMKRIYENQNQHGFYLREKDLYHPIETYDVEVDTTINLISFAFEQGINYKVIRMFNPWLRKSYLNAENDKKYTLKIPVNKKDFYVRELNADSVQTDSVVSDTI